MGTMQLIQAGGEQSPEIDCRISEVVKGGKETYPFIVQIGCGLNCNINSRAAQHPNPMTRAAILRKMTGLVDQLLH